MRGHPVRPVSIGLVAALAALSLCTACSDAPKAARPTRHPVAKYWLRPGTPADEVGPSDTRAPEAGVARFRANLAALSPAARIGVLEGPREQMFGEIVDAVTDPRGQVVVLDSRFNEVRLYTPEGRFLASAGGSGAGPGELNYPNSMALNARGELFVVDVGNARVSVYRLGEGSITFLRAFLFEPATYGVCALGGRLYFYGFMGDRPELVHAFSESGEHLSSFGVVYTWPNPALRSQLLTGQIACDERGGAVLVMPYFLPELRAYATDGTLRWRSTFTEYSPIRMEEIPGGVEQGLPHRGGHFHYARTLTYAPSGHVVVQLGVRTLSTITEQREFDALHTYVFSARSGKGAYAGNRLPVLTEVTAERALSIENDPFPRVTVLAPRKER